MKVRRQPGTICACIGAGALAAFCGIAAAQDPPPPVFTPQPAQAPPPPVFAPPPDPAAPPVFAPQPQPVPQFFDPNAQPGAPIESPKQTMKRMFAGTLATLTQTAGTVILGGLTQAIAGGLTSWFSRRPKSQPDVAAVAQAAPPPPVFAAPVEPAPAVAPAFVAAPQFFDTQTGAVTAPDPVFAQALAAPVAGNEIFAGLAYEVHAVVAGGGTVPVNPATHEFRTGDRFLVFYRPTLPGQMDVFNINPAGVQSQIDRVDLAAGQLAQLGPYEFAAMTGDEQLRLVLSPCSTPELLATTRDIVNVSTAVPSAPAFNLAGCSPATRSIREVRTRDIRKVAVEGATGFALDPVSATEFSTGQVTPREVTIRFRHR